MDRSTSLVDRYVQEAGWKHDEARIALDALHPLGGAGSGAVR